MNQYKSEQIDELYKAILSLNTIEQCYQFFDDLCTIKEIKDMASRLEIAKLLYQGKGYNEVSKVSNVSTATVGRVKKCLEYGQGYQMIFQKENKDGD